MLKRRNSSYSKEVCENITYVVRCDAVSALSAELLRTVAVVCDETNDARLLVEVTLCVRFISIEQSK